MTDIVERLREHARVTPARISGVGLIAEAADEIEWLRGERNRLAADLAKAHLDIVAWIAKTQEAYRD